MKTLVCITPGKFGYVDIDYPVRETGHSILKVHRIGVCGTDLHAFQGTQPFFNYPRRLGHELSAEVVETDDKSFSKGEAVTIIPYFNCGKCIACRNGKPNCCTSIKVFGVHIDGGMTEYISVPDYSLVHGEGLTYDELALVEPFSIGAHGVKRAGVKEGEFVLIIGTGPIGLGLIEFTKIAGGKIIAMDINNDRLRFCKEKLNVSYIINPLEEGVLSRLQEITNNDMPTVIIDATGNQKSINDAFYYLAHGGRYVLVGLQKGAISVLHPEFHKRESTLMSSRNATREDFEHVIHCIKKEFINPENYITHKVSFEGAKDEFTKWFDPASVVIKAMIEI